MKGSRKASTLRTQQAVARHGKAARHPLCQAALALFSMDAESSKAMKNAVWAKEFLNTAEGRKKEAKTLLDRFYNEGKQKEAIRAAELWRKTDELLTKVQQAYPALVKGLAVLNDMRLYFAGHFGRELLAAECAKNKSALRALPRVQKRWKALSDGAGLRNNESRVLGILKMLRDKAIKAARVKDGAVAGYLEAGRGGERPLSDEFWHGRFTIREIHSHLEATYDPGVAGDKEGKEVRRTLEGLGIRWAEDKRGRKWKGPCQEKEKAKRPVGRPRKVKLISTDTIDSVQSFKARKENWWWTPTVEFARKQAANDRELARLRHAKTSLSKTKSARREQASKELKTP